ncbi:GNAT family N-acetyltransferase [Algicella marina]|uniref:GNAT family N-acetyltransferase n=1 Tax=Algicella marina TaxID=2683284 RepID=A0A6P1SXK2_9RHOB|nr:GNAT family N-acetyltransferase [Algicella marina]QHQ35188.1 GNAT family N-acetyltransferase [Algicella marina]
MTTTRPIDTGDFAAWQPLWQAYLAFYEASLAEEIYRTTFARLTDPEVSDYAGFIAESDSGEAIGLVHYITHRHGWRIENVVYLQDLYVSEAARGTGAGRALIEAVYDAADAAGTPTVYWLTQEFNSTARKLYDYIADLTPFIKYQRRPKP